MKGQSLVEFGITLVFLLFLLSGVAEFGILFFQYVQLRDAVQEGALYGSYNPKDLSNIEIRTRGASNKPLDLSDPNILINISYQDNKKCEGDSITVKAIYNHKIFMPFLPKLLGVNNIPLKASVTDTILSPICE